MEREKEPQDERGPKNTTNNKRKRKSSRKTPITTKETHAVLSFEDRIIGDVLRAAKDWKHNTKSDFSIVKILSMIDDIGSHFEKYKVTGAERFKQSMCELRTCGQLLKNYFSGGKTVSKEVDAEFENEVEWENAKNYIRLKDGKKSILFNLAKNREDAMGLLCQLPFNGLFLLKVL